MPGGPGVSLVASWTSLVLSDARCSDGLISVRPVSAGPIRRRRVTSLVVIPASLPTVVHRGRFSLSSEAAASRRDARPLALSLVAPPRTAAALETRTGGGVCLLPRRGGPADPGRGGRATTQCRSIRGPRNTHGPLRFASVMCVISSRDRPARPPQHQQPDSSSAGSTTLGTSCGPRAPSY